jgi:hypothetical protein
VREHRVVEVAQAVPLVEARFAVRDQAARPAGWFGGSGRFRHGGGSLA